MSGGGSELKDQVTAFMAVSSIDWAGTPELECSEHPGSRAVAACAACGKLACATCLCELRGEVLCGPCALARVRKGAFSKTFSFVKQPVFWVSSCIAVSSLLYALGVGNPSAEEMAKADAGRSWHMRDAATAYLSQGARERRRAAVLESKGEPEEAKRWALLASETFSKAATLWGDSPESFSPALASAESLCVAGSKAEALALALKVKPPSENEDLASYHFMLGRIASAAGEAAMARLCWEKALEAAGKAREGFIEGLLRSYAGGKPGEATFAAKVRRVSGLGLSTEEIATEARRLLGEKPKAALLDDEFEAAPRKKGASPKPKASGGDFEIEILDRKEAK